LIVWKAKFIWVKHLGSNYSAYGNKIRLDKQGNFVLAGEFYHDSLDFDPSPLSSYYLQPIGGADIFFAKYDTSGIFKWAKKIGGVGDNYAVDLTLTINDDILISGSYSYTADFDPSSNTAFLTAFQDKLYNQDAFLARYTSSGDYLWVSSLQAKGREIGMTVTEDISGNIIQTIDFDDSLNLGTINNPIWLVPVGYTEQLIATFGSNGKLISTIKIGGDTVSLIRSFSSLINQGSLYLSGCFGGNIDFDPTSGIKILNGSAGSPFIAKYNLNTGINEIQGKEHKLLIYPNPANDFVTIDFNRQGDDIIKLIDVYNVQGRKIISETVKTASYKLSINELSTGLYLVKAITKKGEVITGKLVVCQ